MNRLVRKLTACLGIAALLVMQIAVSAYSCPMQQGGQSMSATDAGNQAASASDDVDAGLPLCGFHCRQATQALDKPQPPGVPPFVATGPTQVLAGSYSFSNTARLNPRPHLPARRSGPALSIRNCCLRI